MDISFQLKWLIAIVKSWNAPKFNLRVPVFQNFSLGGMLRSPSISMPCMLIVLCAVQVACVYIIMGSSFLCIQKCPEILPDQCKISSSALFILLIPLYLAGLLKPQTIYCSGWDNAYSCVHKIWLLFTT